MLQPATFHVPFAFSTTSLAALPSAQEPKTGSDTPAGVTPPTGPGSTGPGSTGVPGTGPGPQPAMGPGSDMLLYMGLFVVLMLFLSMRRDSKARKEQQAMLASIKQGDRIVTTGGIHGTVHRLDEKTVTLLLDTAQVTFERSAIGRVQRDEAKLGEAKRA